MSSADTASVIEPVEQQTVLVSSSSIKASLSLAEPILFLYGFSKNEQRERPPAILRGSLILRVTKPTKIKSVSLKFRGISRTDWPEGIPPKKVETFECKDIYSHVWPFFSAQSSQSDSSGAHVVQPLENELSAMATALPRGRSDRPSQTLSSRSRSRSNTIETFSVFHRHTGSPSPGPRTGDASSKAYRLFQPAEYIYSFELAIPQMLSETIKCNFGHVKYLFELQIDRPGTFKSNLVGTREMTILRSLGMSNLEYSEPIVISRDWEDQLHYEIAIAGKAFVIGSRIPVAFSFVPLAKVRCHRIRIYITEHTEYFCKNRKVHRVEPVHKFLLLEKVSEKGIHDSLLSESTDSSSLTAFEFDVQIPHSFKNRRDRLHPNANVGTIKVHHWVKVVLRLSRAQPDIRTGKTKYYEVSIDSPITLLDPRTITANTLPQYETNGEEHPEHIRPYQEYLDNQIERPIHLMREPSIAPPPFDAEEQPPNAFPPHYDTIEESRTTYRLRYQAYQAQLSGSTSTEAGDSLGVGAPHFSNIIWRDDQSDDSGQASSNSNDPPLDSDHTAVDIRESEAPLSPLETPLESYHIPRTPGEWSTSPSANHSIDHSPMSPSTGGTDETTDPTSTDSRPSAFPFLLQHNELKPDLESLAPDELAPDELPPAAMDSNTLASDEVRAEQETPGRSDSSLTPVRPAETPTQKLHIDTRRDYLYDHPYMPLSPRQGLPYRMGSIPSTTSVHSIPRTGPSTLASPGPSLRPGSSLRDSRDSRSRMGSTSSLRSPRYYRQTSVVSVDIVDQSAANPLGRRTSRVANLSEVEDITDWYTSDNNESTSSLGVSVFEYERPDQNPLLHGGRDASVISADLADFDYEDDAASIYSTSSYMRPQSFFPT